MKRRALFFALAACVAIIQSCHKSEVAGTATTTGINTSIDRSSGLALNNVGDYNNYQLINAGDGKSATVSNMSLFDGGLGAMTTFTNDAFQRFRITSLGNGVFSIMDMGSGKYIQSYNYNGTETLIQASANTTDQQKWIIIPTGAKTYKAINKADGLAITGNDTGRLTLQPFTNATAQLWGYNQLGASAYRDDAVVQFFHRTLHSEGSVAFDQGSSIPLSDGRVLWIAEDSFDGNELTADGNLNCWIFEYRNSVIIQPASHTWDPDQTPNITITTSSDGRPKQVFDIQPNTEWTWPGVGVELGNKVYVYAGEGSGLGATNQALYVLTENPGSYVWSVQRTTPKNMSNQVDIGYSSGMVKPGDGYVYAYGTKGVFFNASQVYVARFAESDPQTWYFWNSAAWDTTRTSANAASIASTQQNVAISYINGKYVMMVMDLGYFCDPSSHNIYMATATSPTGPFTPLKQVFTIEDMYHGHLNRYYTPMIHPEFDNGKNELLITYCVNFGACTTPEPDCENNEMQSRNYQVKGVRVPYSLLGL